MHIFYSWLFFTLPNAHGCNDQLVVKPHAIKTSSSSKVITLPDASRTSRPFCSCDRWEGKDRARQQKDLTCILLMDWGKSSKGSRELRMEAITGAPHVWGLNIPLKRWRTTVTYYLTPIIVAIKKEKKKRWQGCEQLLVGTSNDTTTVNNNMAAPQKIKHRITM